MMISVHSRRPKNHSASASPYGTRPWNGERRSSPADAERGLAHPSSARIVSTHSSSAASTISTP